jgi:hypothetical protein
MSPKKTNAQKNADAVATARVATTWPPEVFRITIARVLPGADSRTTR